MDVFMNPGETLASLLRTGTGAEELSDTA